MIRRTVIGSFPRLPGDAESSIEKAVKLQLKYGINPVSDGEQSYDMIRYFKQIPGLKEGAGELYIGGQIRPLRNPAEAYKVQEFKVAQRSLKKLGEDHIEVKSSITGPITLGFTCAANKAEHYTGLLDEQIYLDIADALSPILQELIRLGSWVQIDEPGISAGYISPARAKEMVNHLISGVEGNGGWEDRLSIHICGSLKNPPSLLDDVLDIKARILSLAFSGKAESENISILSKERFEEHGKKLGVGCVTVDARDVLEVEGETQINERIKHILDRVDSRNVALLHPDCGLKQSTLKVAERILQNMMEATRAFVSN